MDITKGAGGGAGVLGCLALRELVCNPLISGIAALHYARNTHYVK